MTPSEAKPTGLIYITGVGGTGKSSLQKRLEARGYESIDADHGYCAFINPRTGEQVVSPTLETRTPEWLKAHVWRFIPGKIEELHVQAQNKLLFVCGTARDELDYQHYFKKVFALVIDDEALTRRLRERPGDHAYGKSDHELQLSLEENAETPDRYAKLDAVLIDATKPLDEIIDEILESINQN